MKQGAIPEGYKPVVVEFFRFQNAGDKLEGKLIIKTTITTNKNQDGKQTGKVGKYSVLANDGKKYSFLGSVILDELLSTVPLGSMVYIIYDYLEHPESGYDIKHFKVYFK
jgi:hypothetical protein